MDSRDKGTGGERRVRQRARRQGRTMAPTLTDVARLADVSTATVSRVLNNSGQVSEDRKRAVEEAIEALGYVPNSAARSLVSQRYNTIGAIVPTLENATFARLVEAFQKRVSASGAAMMVASSAYDPEVELKHGRKLLESGVDGIMLIGSVHNPKLDQLLREHGVAVVSCLVLDQERDTASVGFDNATAAAMAADYLMDLGHRRIGLIAGMIRMNDRAEQRVRGIQAALQRRGVPFAAEYLLERPYRIEEGGVGFQYLMGLDLPPTAIICGNDVLAFGALIQARRSGLDVPGDVSIIGFDDQAFAAHLTPSLTTLHVPAEEIGIQAADYILTTVAGGTAPHIVPVAVNLVVRQSTGRPKPPQGQ